MLRIAICDDEKIILDKIEKLVKNELDNLKIKNEINTFISGESLLEYSNLDDFDIIFLDIELKTINGMDIAQTLRNKAYDKIIVFVTSFADYSIVGYKVNAFRFILKDNLEEELSECIRNTVAKLGLKKAAFDEFVMDIRDIVYIESAKHQVVIHFKNGDDYKIYDTLDNIEKKLNSSNLVRVHQSYLVNVIYVKDVKCYTLNLSGKENIEIPIPKARYSEVKKKISIKKSLWR